MASSRLARLVVVAAVLGSVLSPAAGWNQLSEPAALAPRARRAAMPAAATAPAEVLKGLEPTAWSLQRLRQTVLDQGPALRPVTRCELELLLPRDRAALRSRQEGEADAAAAAATKKAEKGNLALRLSTRAYEMAVAENHGDVKATMERWRRVVALRQNRVLVPGRAAELYSQLISTLLYADEFELARQLLDYVGLTSEVIVPSAPSSPPTVDLNALCFTVAKTMLDIDLERWEWEVDGRARGLPEPLSAKERGENVAEWLWQQVMPEGGRGELEHFVLDMLLSVLRMAFREARSRGHGELRIRRQQVEAPSAPYRGIGKRGLLVPADCLELLRERDAKPLALDVVFV